MTVGSKVRMAGEVRMAGISPLPVNATTVGERGAPGVRVSVPVRSPGADGLKRTTMVALLPGAIVNGSDGAPTMEKSPPLGPPIVRLPPMVTPQVPVFDRTIERSLVEGDVRSSTATPPKSSAV